jgi:hypothetical protein
MKSLILICGLILTVGARGEEAQTYAIMMQRKTLSAVMAYYEHLTGKKVQIAEGVSAT